MKRTLALVLALIMILCMIPASMLTAFARGRGVYPNTIPNQTRNGIIGQYIPETVVIDGVLDDTGWREDDWKRVNIETGTWNVQYPKDENRDFAYKYNVRKDYYYLYGAFAVPTSEAGLVKLWLNNDAKGQNRYSHIITFDITGEMGGEASYQGFGGHSGTWTRKAANGTDFTDSSSYYFEKSKVVFKEDTKLGLTNIEFKVLLADFCPEANPNLTYFVSVDAAQEEVLWHPMIEIDELDAQGNKVFDRESKFPSETNWPANGCDTIDDFDLRGIGGYENETDNDSFKPAITVDGEFNEAEWAHHTDFYGRWYHRTNLVDYVDNKNFKKPYSNLVNNKLPMLNGIAAEFDLRVSSTQIMGAALVHTTTNNPLVFFNMFPESGSPIEVAIDYSAGGALYYRCTSNGTDFLLTGAHAFELGVISTGAPGTYSFEFVIYRDALNAAYKETFRASEDFDFLPVSYTFVADSTPYHTTPIGPTETDGWNIAEGVEAYHFSTEEALKNAGAPEGVKVEFYEPYTTYFGDGYLGEKAWPGLTASAGGPVNADWITSGNSNRINDIHYLHSLRADYEFVYGALHIQPEKTNVDNTTYFGNWKHGSKDAPNGGDYFTLWTKDYDAATQTYSAGITRFDIWTYEENDEIKARIGGYTGNAYSFLDEMTAAFVNRDGVFAFEYRIPVSSVSADRISYDISVEDKPTRGESDEILQYYTSLSVANQDDNGTYAHMLWPRGGNSVLPGESGFIWDSSIEGNPEYLRYDNVIRSIEPDGRLVETNKFDLVEVNFNNSEYRDMPKYGNYLPFSQKVYAGKDYLYIGAQIEGNISYYNTKFILWAKNHDDGAIHKLEFYNDGAYNRFKLDGTVKGAISDTNYAFTSTNGVTYFEAVLAIDELPISDEGFDFYIEVEQKFNKEMLSRIYPKIELDPIDYASQINTVKAWYQNAGPVEDLIHFPREEIIIDGDLGDNGWDPDEWTYVSNKINANRQETGLEYSLFESDFYYQLRVDDEHLYVAAVITYSDKHNDSTEAGGDGDGFAEATDPLVTPTYESIAADNPGFRLWLKSGNNGPSIADGNSNSYTHYYDIKIVDGKVQYQSYVNKYPTYANNTRPLYNKDYLFVVPQTNEDGSYKTDENGKILYQYVDETHPSVQTYTELGENDSALWGSKEYIIKELEANRKVKETEVLMGELINPEQYKEYSMLEKINTIEAGEMVSGKDKFFDNGRKQTLGDNSIIVEFKVSLDEFYGHDQFQYQVSSSTWAKSWNGTRTTMYPAIPSEVDSGDSYFHYYYPYWYWKDNTSVTVTEEVRADMTLLTYKRPVITLGAKVSKTYMYQGNETNALRMGGLWEEKYIRKTKELAAKQWADEVKRADGYWPDKDGNPNWVDYWDVKAMGIVLIPTYLLKENKDPTNPEKPGKYDLFKGTSRSVWMDADGMVKWQGSESDDDLRNNYADYKNYAFYVTVVNVPTDANFCFRGFVDYYDEVLDKAPSYYDVILERSIDMVVDSAIRTGDDEKDEEDNALPGGDFSRDDESGFTGTDGSDYENSLDPSEDPSEDVSEDVSDDAVIEPGYTVADKGVTLDIAWPGSAYYEADYDGVAEKSLVYAGLGSAGQAFSVGGFNTAYDSSNQGWFHRIYLVETPEGYWEVKKVTLPGEGNNTDNEGGSYLDWIVGDRVMVVSMHAAHGDDYNTFKNYNVGTLLKLEGMTYETIAGVSNPDTPISATLREVIKCENHNFKEATCTAPRTCSICGATDGAPKGHDYDRSAEPTCTESVDCNVCGQVIIKELGHVNGRNAWWNDATGHWWQCTREGCPNTGEKWDFAVHSYKNGVCSVCGWKCLYHYEDVTEYEAKEATCTENGRIAYFECECGLKFSDEDCTQQITDSVVIPALGHDFDEETGICSRCQEEEQPTVVGALEYLHPEDMVLNSEGGYYYSLVFADSNANGSAWGNGSFPKENTDTPKNSDLAWWHKIKLRVVTGADGKEYYKVEAVCPPATWVDGVVDGELNNGWDDYFDWEMNSDTIIIAVYGNNSEKHPNYDKFIQRNIGDVLYLNKESNQNMSTLGNTSNTGLLENTNLLLHKHKFLDATCTTPRTCRECGMVDTTNPSLGHTLGADATCTTAQVCTACGAILNPALGHEAGEMNDEIPATCETAGRKAYGACIRCSLNVDANGNVLADLVIPALGHKTVKVDAIAPDCDDAGNIEYYTCSGCDKWFSDKEATTEITDKNSVVVGALGHEMKSEWTKDNTAHWHECIRCDYAEDYAEHSYPANSDICDACEYEKNHVHVKGEQHFDAIAPDCDNEGQLEYWLCAGISCDEKLDADGNVLTNIVVPATGHSWTDADCDTPKTCSVCGITEGEPLGHDWADATCTAPKTCTVCGATEGEPIDHNFYNYESDDNATCTTDGTKTAYCEYGCGTKKTVTDNGSATGHSSAGAATCTAPETCIVCGAEINPALGHDWADATEVAPKTCKRCGATEGNPLAGKNTVAYVPLDQRPVNLDRVEYLAGASGFNLRVPEYEDIVTWMDTNKDAQGGTAHGGNPVNILAWLKQQEEEGVNNYVISLDQVFSGGLVESRLQTGYHSATDWNVEVDNYAGSAEEATINFIAELASDPTNKIVLFDTLMRLAPETEYKGYTQAEYDVLRAYGDNGRPVLSGDALTVENIFANYRKNSSGGTISTDGIEDAVDQHLDARKRKLELMTYLTSADISGVDHIFVGVDDSSKDDNIQKNDRAYYTKLLEGKPYYHALFGGADELGMLGMARMGVDINDPDKSIPGKVTYFGDGYTGQADNYDFESLENNVNKHLAALNIVESNDANALQILVLARATTALETPTATGPVNTNAVALIKQLRANIKAGIPTCVIDASNPWASNARVFSDALFWSFENEGAFDLSETLAISCWNTVGNTVGIGLSNAVGRYTYINNAEEVTEESNKAFLQGFTTALVKDMAYRAHTSGNVNGASGEFVVGYKNFPFDGINNGTGEWDTVNRILKKINARNTILGKLVDGEYTKVLFDGVTIDPNSVVWTWDREFECEFDVSVGGTYDVPAEDFTSVEIPLNYVNASYTNIVTPYYPGNIFVYAAEDYNDGTNVTTVDSIAGSDTGFTWWYKALLEYDDVSGKYRVVATDGNGGTAYKNWYVGVDRIVILNHSGTSSAIKDLQVDQYLELTGTTHEALKAASSSSLSGVSMSTVRNYGTAEITAPEVLTPNIVKPQYNNFTVAYIPLDDRPVHTTRVELEAEAAGITLLMPEDSTMYQTVLGTSGHGGDTQAILAWLKEQEANGVDYYVIALDQVFSGGLVNSRYSDASFDGQLTPEDLNTANFLVELAKNNHVVYTETIMRLAATSGYRAHTSDIYTALRAYGHYDHLALSETGTGINKLTLEHVISGYRYGDDGFYGLYRGGTIEGATASTTEAIIKGYIGARERKLRITDYLLRNAGGNIDHMYIGMDDSATGETIQANEKRYLDMVIKKTNANALIFAGADEMGVMGVAAMTNLYVKSDAEKIPAADGWTISKIPVNVVYYGDGAGWQADGYDNGTLKNAIDLHLKSLEAYQVHSDYATDKKVIQIVVATRGTEKLSFSSTDTAAAQTQIYGTTANAQAAAIAIKDHLNNDRPVCIIDAGKWNANSLNILNTQMWNQNVFQGDDFTEVLGFSSWNTMGNSIGIAMANAFSRYNYIMNANVVTKDSNLGFLKQIAYSFVKDAAYKTNPPETVTSGWNMGTSSQKYYQYIGSGYYTSSFTGNEFLGYVNDSTNILLKGGVSTAYDHNVTITAPDWHSNWNRPFECWFTINATSNELDESAELVAGDGIALPDEEIG